MMFGHLLRLAWGVMKNKQPTKGKRQMKMILINNLDKSRCE